MRNKHRNLLSVALVLLCIALLAGTAVLLLRTLPKKQPGTVETIQTGAVFDQTDNTAAPDREQAYDGELPNLSDTLEPDEAETPAPEDETALAAAKLADQTLASMTLDEKLWQLFFVTPEAITKVETATLAGEATKAAIESQPVGGLVYFAKNLENRAQTVTLLENSQSYSKIPLFLGVDEEGGLVARLANNAAFGLPKYESAAAVGASGNASDAEDMGRTIGAYLADYGFTVDFAPVADVYTNPANTVIGSRAFSADANTAAAMAGACARGLASQGVLPVYKHFPGHGDTAEDSHNGLAVTYKTHDELAACEWIPYSANDLTGCAVMVGHIAAPNVTGDLTPASLSGTMITGYLRGELGFTGLVITDSMAMHGVTDAYSSGDAAIAAIEAGVDIILMPEVLSEAFDAVAAAVENGTISEARLNESVYRVLQYKQLYGIFNP